MSEMTVARTQQRKDSHWYYTDGRPCYELPKKDGKGMKNPTLADARKLNLMPSVTTILKLLNKPQLVDWMIEQACLAVLTSPRNPGEELDAFVYRILHVEEVQHEERDSAADKGTAVHAALDALASGKTPEPEYLEWVTPAWNRILQLGDGPNYPELIMCGDGYAGKTDLVRDMGVEEWLIDYKCVKNIPEKSPWPEHQLQLAAYAQARSRLNAGKAIRTANLYVSSREPGKFVFYENTPWQTTYERGFRPLVLHWQWANNYSPTL